MYPLFLDILGLEKISVGVPYYNAVFVPLMIPLILLVGYVLFFCQGPQSIHNCSVIHNICY